MATSIGRNAAKTVGGRAPANEKLIRCIPGNSHIPIPNFEDDVPAFLRGGIC